MMIANFIIFGSAGLKGYFPPLFALLVFHEISILIYLEVKIQLYIITHKEQLVRVLNAQV